ncbi:MAG: hypothetical protein EU532_13145 [Promethearchaeota archaeon]|nr:MAG: hypothetical protein EU532_13145 [Candidatus Lokiarchaeota archaeon]
MKKLKKVISNIKKRIIYFIKDDFGGSLVEYALLVGFALFVFLILVGVITSIINWTLGLSNDFFDIFGVIGG